eukprot:c5833_g1_i1.p1 GENE.c5833_g1_i1~~c5833_g1_i1.p1  ORF type:complete len:188 (-),score=33.65 c5833_g1_i1:26-589(-)
MKRNLAGLFDDIEICSGRKKTKTSDSVDDSAMIDDASEDEEEVPYVPSSLFASPQIAIKMEKILRGDYPGDHLDGIVRRAMQETIHNPRRSPQSEEEKQHAIVLYNPQTPLLFPPNPSQSIGMQIDRDPPTPPTPIAAPTQVPLTPCVGGPINTIPYIAPFPSPTLPIAPMDISTATPTPAYQYPRL